LLRSWSDEPHKPTLLFSTYWTWVYVKFVFLLRMVLNVYIFSVQLKWC
jgi:hypothetical protein